MHVGDCVTNVTCSKVGDVKVHIQVFSLEFLLAETEYTCSTSATINENLMYSVHNTASVMLDIDYNI